MGQNFLTLKGPNGQSLAQAHAAMIGHFMGHFHAPVSEVVREFRNDPSIIAPVFNQSCPPIPAPAIVISLAPLMIPPISSLIWPNCKPIMPTDLVPSYPPTLTDHFDVESIGHIPSHPPLPSSVSDEEQPLVLILATIEVDQVTTTIALEENDQIAHLGVWPDVSWHQNFKEPEYHFFKLIPNSAGTLHVTPFICADLVSHSLWLLLTNRHNCYDPWTCRAPIFLFPLRPLSLLTHLGPSPSDSHHLYLSIALIRWCTPFPPTCTIFSLPILSFFESLVACSLGCTIHVSHCPPLSLLGTVAACQHVYKQALYPRVGP